MQNLQFSWRPILASYYRTDATLITCPDPVRVLSMPSGIAKLKQIGIGKILGSSALGDALLRSLKIILRLNIMRKHSQNWMIFFVRLKKLSMPEIIK